MIISIFPDFSSTLNNYFPLTIFWPIVTLYTYQ